MVSSAHDLAEGGLAIALAESAFANGLGVDVKVDITNAQLFSETQGRFILSISPENQATFEKLLTESSVSGEVIGKVTDSGIFVIFFTFSIKPTIPIIGVGKIAEPFVSL